MSKVRDDIWEQAHSVRVATQTAARYLPDEVAVVQPAALYDAWSGEGVAYAAGDIRKDGGQLYRCVTAHISQASWRPADAPSLWTRIADPAQEWPEWIQPTGSHNAYLKGDKVSHGGKRWVSDVNDNVWEPGVSGWTEAA